MSDKTEEPTPKRLRRAREEGDSPLSGFAAQSVAFLAAIAVAPAALSALAASAAADLRAATAAARAPEPRATFDLAALVGSTLALAVPIVATAAATAAAAALIQTGGAIATKRLAPDLSRLDPIRGLRQLASAQRVTNVVRALLFAAIVGWIVRGAFLEHAVSFARSAGRIDAGVALAASIALEVAKKAAIGGLFLAAVDVVVTRRAWLRRLRMTKAEIKREHKESEGDPQLKSARERAHHEMLAAATIANVKKASVVIVNPTHIACALEYQDGEQEAPVVVAAGRGDLAARIVEAAHQFGVPVLRDVPLARALVELEVGTEIPEALYEAVAEILREAWSERER